MTAENRNKGLVGAAVGLLNGLFGGGGGMAVVPFLVSLGYAQKEAHATAILVILPICAVSAFVYCLGGRQDPTVLLPTALGAVLGGWLGAKLLSRLGGKTIKIVFAALMLAAGVRMAL